MAYDKLVTFRVPPDLHERMKDRAKELEMSLSEYVRQLFADDADSGIADPNFDINRTVKLTRTLAEHFLTEAKERRKTVADLIVEHLQRSISEDS